MRSHLIHDALKTVPNRYVLCQVASKATRKFHRPSSRVQDTMNEVFERFSHSEEAKQIVGEAVAETRRRAA